MKKRLISKMVSLCLASALFFTSCGLTEDEIAAAKGRLFVVESDYICTVSQARVLLQEEQKRMETLFGSGVWMLKDESIDMTKSMKDTVLNQLLVLEKATIFAKEHGIELTNEERTICFAKADAYLGSIASATVTSLALTRESVAELYGKFLLASKVYDALTLSCEDEISDTEALVITLEIVLCASLESAEYVKDCLDQETDIYHMADLYSLANDVQINVYKGQKGEEFDAVAFSMKEGEISQPIETAEGFYIIKCVSNYNKEATDARKKVLSESIKQEYFKKVFEEETKDYDVKLYTKVWDEMTVLRDFYSSSFFDIFENEEITKE